MNRHAAVLALCACLGACDGVGRSLVDQRDKPRPESSCEPPPACSERAEDADASEVLVPSIEDIVGEECATPLPTLCIADPDVPVPGDCDARLAIDESELSPGLPELACSDVRLFAGERERVRLRGLAWSNVHISLTSTRPFTLALEDAVLEHARIDLLGPVSVRVAGGSLEQVLVVGERASEGSPRLDLTESVARGLTVLRPDAGFPGDLTVTRSDLFEVFLSADHMHLESDAIEQATLMAGQLSMVDARLAETTISVESALISAAFMERTHVVQCGSLTLVESTVEASHLAACERGPLRAYGSTVKRSAVDGPVESDTSSFSSVRFGEASNTELVAWDSAFDRVALCSHVDGASFGPGNQVSCSACLNSPDICLEPGALLPGRGNACEPLNEPVVCEGELERPRPS